MKSDANTTNNGVRHQRVLNLRLMMMMMMSYLIISH